MAGNFATSYMIITGPDEPDIHARYRVECYALVVESPWGEERHFLAVPQSAEGMPPDTLLIGGPAFWLEEDQFLRLILKLGQGCRNGTPAMRPGSSRRKGISLGIRALCHAIAVRMASFIEIS